MEGHAEVKYPGAAQQHADVGSGLQREQLEFVLRGQGSALLGNSIVAVAAVAVLWGSLPNRLISIWLAITLAVNLVRHAMNNLQVEGRILKGMPEVTFHVLAGGAFTSGCLWAILPFVLRNMDSSAASLLLFMIAGVTAGAVARGVGYAWGAIAFAVPLLSVVMVKLIVAGDMRYYVGAATVGLYFLFLMGSAFASEKSLKEMIRIKQEAVVASHSAQLYQAAMENAPFGMFIATPDLKIVNVNSAFCRMFLCAPEDAYADGIRKFTFPEDMPAMMESYRKLLDGEVDRTSIEKRNLRKNGEVFWAYTERTLLRDRETGAPSFVIVQIEDVDQRKRAENELAGAIRRQRLAVEIAGLGEFHFDPKSGSAIWSDRLYEIFGVERETFDCSIASWISAIHPDDRERVAGEANPDNVKPQSAGIFRTSYRIVRPSGDIRHVKMASIPDFGADENATSIIGVVADVTNEVEYTQALEREKAELAKALARAQIATEIAEFGVYEFDIKSGEMSWDERLFNIFGLDPRSVEPSRDIWRELIHPNDRERVIEEINSAASDKAPSRITYRVVRPSGEVRHLRTGSSYILGPEGNAATVLGVTWDITDQVLLVEMIDHERSLHAATLRSIGDAVIRTDSEGRIRYMNRAAEEISGVKSEEITNVHFMACFDLEGKDGEIIDLLGSADDAARFLESRQVSCCLTRPSAKPREVEVSTQLLRGPSGLITGSVIVIRDVTELRESQAAVVESEKLFRIALEHAPVGLSVVDEEGRYSFVNRALANISGYPATKMIGRPVSDFLCSKDPLANDIVRFRKEFDSDRDNIEFEKVSTRSSGEDVRLRINVRRVRDDTGRVLYSVSQVQDITAETRRIEELHEAKELAQVTVSSASEGIVRTDADGRITLCNAVASGLVGMKIQDCIGQTFDDVFRLAKGVDETPVNDPTAKVLRDGKPVRLNSSLRLQRADGTSRRVNTSVAPLLGTDKHVNGTVVIIQDATEVAQLTDRLLRQAYTDELTGLANRRAFEEQLEIAVRDVKRRRARSYLLLLDLDHFKIINDSCGHAVGDRVLREVSSIFLSHVRKSDIVARLGGDEFAIIMHGADDQAASRTTDDIISAVSDYRLYHDGKTFQVGVSIGITAIEKNSDTSSIAIQADTACYAAKNMGRGRSYFYRSDDAAIRDATQAINWFQRIQNGLNKGLFRVFLQDIVSSDRETVGYEALIRLVEGGKVIAPGAFIEAARRHGLMPKLDRFMFENVISILNRERSDGSYSERKYISVNLSPASVADRSFRDWLRNALKENKGICGSLWVELTETDRLQWTDDEVGFLSDIKSAGARVLLDDFGTGYNSFDILKKFPFDGVKLDHSVVKDIANSPIDRALVAASRRISREYKLDVIAEGIEFEDDFKYLSKFGIKKYQGFLFDKPEDAAEKVTKRRKALSNTA